MDGQALEGTATDRTGRRGAGCSEVPEKRAPMSQRLAWWSDKDRHLREYLSKGPPKVRGYLLY